MKKTKSSPAQVKSEPGPHRHPFQDDDLLVALLKSTGAGFISGEEMARTLDVSRAAIWKKIKELEEVGYRIEAVPHLGYRLTGLPDRIVPEEIRCHLRTRSLGRRIFVFPSTDSTNRLALDMGRKGAPHGQAILAEAQTSGRGRLGRSWASPAGEGIYLSLILRPKLELSQVSKLTLAAAVATAEALEAVGVIGAKIKWPNDLMVQGRKVCGILTEMVAEADRVECVVLGIGINVNTPHSHLPPNATSLKLESGEHFDRSRLVALLLNGLEVRLEQASGSSWQAVRAAWNARSAVRGRSVKIMTLNASLQGVARGIDSEGALLIKTREGIRKIYSGDVLSCR